MYVLDLVDARATIDGAENIEAAPSLVDQLTSTVDTHSLDGEDFPRAGRPVLPQRPSDVRVDKRKRLHDAAACGECTSPSSRKSCLPDGNGVEHIPHGHGRAARATELGASYTAVEGVAILTCQLEGGER